MVAYQTQLYRSIFMGEFRATCFGFDSLTDGYFCMGVYAGDDDELLAFHGAGFWNTPEEVEEAP